MLKNSKRFLELRKLAKKVATKQIVDIILFGSFVKGKAKARDIDVCIVFRNKVDLKIVREFGSKAKAHVSSLTVDEFFIRPHALVRSLLFEGVSLLSGKKLSENFNLIAKSLYTYNLSNTESSKKVRFVYLLKGRKGETGLVERLGGSFLAPSCFVIPSAKDNEMLEVMKRWKISFKRQPIMLIY